MKTLFTSIILFLSFTLSAQQNISDARRNPGSEITVSGIVTNGNEFGIIRYFQDSSAGLAAYGEKTTAVHRGDSVTITGTLKEYRNLLEIEPIVSITVHSSGNALPAPKEITIEQMGEAYEGELVKIMNAEFVDASGTFSGNNNYNFTAGGTTAVLRINTNSPLVGEVIPTGKFNLVAICSQFSYNDNDTRTGYQLLPRDMDDFISAKPINFTAPVEITEITTDGFALTWETDADATSEVRFGDTPNKSTWNYIQSEIALTANDGFLHKAYIKGLSPASVIYAEAFSVFNSDTAFSSTGVYATQSNSSGKINVYFNSPVNHEVATGKLAQNIGNAMEDTLIAYINKAKKTIDFCIYNINNGGISNVSEALNNAHDRGVRIRFITDESTNHSGTDDLKSEIPVLERPEVRNGGIMHNKFAVIDANAVDPNQPWIWTGSTNISFGQINNDANNSIFIQDQTLAKAYQIEFEEMWGSSGNQPNPSNAKFGDAKTDNTPHRFIINEYWIESYFSPSDNTNQKIIDALNTADNDLNIETMLMTRSDLALAIWDAQKRGATVQVITNDERDNSESVNDILSDNLPSGNFVFDDAVSGIMHNKVAIVDANFATSDPQIITGSHNWSNSANDKNDENTLIIHSAEIANIFFQQFAERYKANGGNLYVSAEIIQLSKIKVYPNPVTDIIYIESERYLSEIGLYNLAGIKIQEILPAPGSKTNQIDLSEQQPGLYILKVNCKNGKLNVFKILKR